MRFFPDPRSCTNYYPDSKLVSGNIILILKICLGWSILLCRLHSQHGLSTEARLVPAPSALSIVRPIIITLPKLHIRVSLS